MSSANSEAVVEDLELELDSDHDQIAVEKPKLREVRDYQEVREDDAYLLPIFEFVDGEGEDVKSIRLFTVKPYLGVAARLPTLVIEPGNLEVPGTTYQLVSACFTAITIMLSNHIRSVVVLEDFENGVVPYIDEEIQCNNILMNMKDNNPQDFQNLRQELLNIKRIPIYEKELATLGIFFGGFPTEVTTTLEG